MRILTRSALVAATAGVLVAPAAAQARDYYGYYDNPRASSRSYEQCRVVKKRGEARGALIGTAVGGLLGHEVAKRGSRTEAALLGAGLGAFAGYQIGKGGKRC